MAAAEQLRLDLDHTRRTLANVEMKKVKQERNKGHASDTVLAKASTKSSLLESMCVWGGVCVSVGVDGNKSSLLESMCVGLCVYEGVGVGVGVGGCGFGWQQVIPVGEYVWGRMGGCDLSLLFVLSLVSRTSIGACFVHNTLLQYNHPHCTHIHNTLLPDTHTMHTHTHTHCTRNPPHIHLSPPPQGSKARYREKEQQVYEELLDLVERADVQRNALAATYTITRDIMTLAEVREMDVDIPGGVIDIRGGGC